ncbi:hypothetical protein [Clostridium thermobutyricum]|uniref:hypothetical protein n=1 Tax=Clostridium thermobutyricum TaxID=29372 RepID=UPI0018ABF02A|nr:hypothetical protein [Clostridium thermobutyricum]
MYKFYNSFEQESSLRNLLKFIELKKIGSLKNNSKKFLKFQNLEFTPDELCRVFPIDSTYTILHEKAFDNYRTYLKDYANKFYSNYLNENIDRLEKYEYLLESIRIREYLNTGIGIYAELDAFNFITSSIGLPSNIKEKIIEISKLYIEKEKDYDYDEDDFYCNYSLDECDFIDCIDKIAKNLNINTFTIYHSDIVNELCKNKGSIEDGILSKFPELVNFYSESIGNNFDTFSLEDSCFYDVFGYEDSITIYLDIDVKKWHMNLLEKLVYYSSPEYGLSGEVYSLDNNGFKIQIPIGLLIGDMSLKFFIVLILILLINGGIKNEN